MSSSNLPYARVGSAREARRRRTRGSRKYARVWGGGGGVREYVGDGEVDEEGGRGRRGAELVVAACLGSVNRCFLSYVIE